MARKNLYIYTSLSLQPDLYINILGQCFREFKDDQFEEILLLRIHRGTASVKDEYRELRQIRENIIQQLAHLCNSKYLKWSKQSQTFDLENGEFEAYVNEEFKGIYHKILEKITSIGEIGIKVIDYSDLEEDLKILVGRRQIEGIFDLTGIPKRDFLDLSLILLSLFSSLYIFEMDRKFTYDHQDFIHNLTAKDFNYISLNKPEYEIKKRAVFSLEESKKQWETLISKNKLREALESIQTYLFSRDSKNSQESQIFTVTSARYHQLSLEEQFGVADEHFHKNQLNQIRKSLVEFIHDLK